MPVSIFEIGKLNRNQKVELVKSFTEVASEVTKIPKESFYVLIKENEVSNIGIGGELASELRFEAYYTKQGADYYTIIKYLLKEGVSH
jgi:4-oxalocrotonate tautomerase